MSSFRRSEVFDPIHLRELRKGITDMRMRDSLTSVEGVSDHQRDVARGIRPKIK